MKQTVTIQKKATVEADGKHYNGNAKAVICLTNGQKFTSCVDAAKAFGVHQASMSAYCTGKVQHPKGYEFCYIEDLPLHYDKIAAALTMYGAEEMARAEEIKRQADLDEATRLYLRNMARKDKAINTVLRCEDKINKYANRIKELGGEVPKCAAI